MFFGGWSPQLLDAEMPAPLWPPQVVQDLNTRYFHEAAVQIGVDETNDFVFGQMHLALRAMLDAAPEPGSHGHSIGALAAAAVARERIRHREVGGAACRPGTSSPFRLFPDEQVQLGAPRDQGDPAGVVRVRAATTCASA